MSDALAVLLVLGGAWSGWRGGRLLVRSLAAAARMGVTTWFTDAGGRFALSLLEPVR